MENIGTITSWHSYPSIFALGHSYLEELLTDPVIVEEKIDGSQFSFGIFNGELHVRSKGKQIFLEAPEKMFLPAIEYVLSIKDLLWDGWTYRGEFLAKPKHNTLAYDRIPKNNIIIFDINTGHEVYMPYAQKEVEAARLNLEIVPLFFEGKLTSYEQFQEYLQRVSCLGGQKIEGVVIKNYSKFGADKKVLMGKFVSEAFKETHANEWKRGNPGTLDIISSLVSKYKTPARWAKAVQHLRDDGKLENSPKDIGRLLKELQTDLLKECEEEIKDALSNWALPKIQRGCMGGFPGWYKQELAKLQFV